VPRDKGLLEVVSFEVLVESHWTLGNEQECESIGGNVNMQIVTNVKCCVERNVSNFEVDGFGFVRV